MKSYVFALVLCVFGCNSTTSNNNSVNREGTMSRVTINGKSYDLPPHQSLSVINGDIYLDGVKFNSSETKDRKIVNIVFEQSVGDVNIDIQQGEVTVKGDAKNIDCTNISVGGNVFGDIDGTNITIKGSVSGDIDGTNVKVQNK